MVKFFPILTFSFLALFGSAQETPGYMGKGLLQIQPTVSPGYLFAEQTVTSYFRANTEYYIQDNISIRTDVHIFFATQKELDEPILMNHSATLGVFVHKKRGQLDFYFGFQPGVAITQTKVDSIASNDFRFSPILSVTPGANFYLNRFLHFHLCIQYVHGNHVPLYGKVLQLDELRLSTGLGINFNVLAKNNKTEKSTSL